MGIEESNLAKTAAEERAARRRPPGKRRLSQGRLKTGRGQEWRERDLQQEFKDNLCPTRARGTHTDQTVGDCSHQAQDPAKLNPALPRDSCTPHGHTLQPKGVMFTGHRTAVNPRDIGTPRHPRICWSQPGTEAGDSLRAPLVAVLQNSQVHTRSCVHSYGVTAGPKRGGKRHRLD